MLTDLDDEFQDSLGDGRPRGSASLWYWDQAFRSIRPLVVFRFESLLSSRFARAYGLACGLFLASLSLGVGGLTILFEHYGPPSLLRALAYPAVLLGSTALATRLGIRQAGDCDDLAAGSAVALLATFVVVLALGSCTEPPPIVAWAVFLTSAFLGVGAGWASVRKGSSLG